jgi:hypothetical protein
MLLPPLMSTPRTGGVPEAALPAPPGPFAGEIPARAFASEPCPTPDFAAPLPAPEMPLPGSLPRLMPSPPPLPPIPVLSPPVGDMASDPVLPLVGIPTFEPGWLEMTAPALDPLPALFGRASAEPTSVGAPRPSPLRPSPDPVVAEPPPTDGGGGTTLLADSDPPIPAAPPLFPVPPCMPETEGGGGTTLGVPAYGAALRE